VDHVSPAPAAGRKRKRTANSHVGKSPYINHSGFVFRSSDTQLAQRRLEVSPSRSESPFDSPDKLETLPPVRPRSKPPVSPLSQSRTQRLKTVIEQTTTDEPVLAKPEETTIRYDYRLLRVCLMLTYRTASTADYASRHNSYLGSSVLREAPK
jgi:hypothetical protein